MGELHAKLGVGSAMMWILISTPGSTGVEGAGGTGGPGCNARGRRQHHRQPNFARNLSWSFFEMPEKRCNSNDANSMFQ